MNALAVPYVEPNVRDAIAFYGETKKIPRHKLVGTGLNLEPLPDLVPRDPGENDPVLSVGILDQT
jgi:hypothetical protein